MKESRDIARQLDRTGLLIKSASVCLATFTWLTMILGIWFLFFIADNLLHLPSGLRISASLIGLALSLNAVYTGLLKPLLKKRSPEQTAVTLERTLGIRHNTIINACCFENTGLLPEESGFAKRTMAESRNMLDRLRPSAILPSRKLMHCGISLALAALLWIIYLAGFGRYAVNAAQRFANPLTDVPPAGSAILLVTPDSDITVMEGEDVTVNTEIRLPADSSEPLAPVIAWDETRERVPLDFEDTEQSAMKLLEKGRHTHVFHNVRRSFTFRVKAHDTYSRSVLVNVVPAPSITHSVFHVSPPAYTGVQSENIPGAPSSALVPAGSTVELRVKFDMPVRNVCWRVGQNSVDCSPADELWTATQAVTASVPYSVVVQPEISTGHFALCRAHIQAEPDSPPSVEFLNDNLNVILAPGSRLDLRIQVGDNFGVKRIRLTRALLDSDTPPDTVRDWSYMGPPGVRGPVVESHRMQTAGLEPGKTYRVIAEAEDFSGSGRTGLSRPLVLRIRTVEEMKVHARDSLARAFELLRQTITRQKKANSLSSHLDANLQEAVDSKHLPGHSKEMCAAQEKAVESCKQAMNAFLQCNQGDPRATTLKNIYSGEMQLVVSDIKKIAGAGEHDSARGILNSVASRQDYILRRLIELLGSTWEDIEQARPEVKVNEDNDSAEISDIANAMKQTHDLLEKFTEAQEKIVDQSKTLADRQPEDLTTYEEDILGEMARQEARWAELLQESLTDFSKLPLQDFADGSLSEEFNEVFQEVQLAADALYRKNVNMAVPHEQSGQESAEELMHNLERWMPDAPDNLKWEMEEPPMPIDAPMAELPGELEDIVGELIDSEEAMTDDVEDVSSSWIDSIDKGAGWDAMDGPISSMSAKGITGNMLPNQHEIGGRSGEGRTGRSHGQMVESEADGKKGRQTPSRMTPQPFEEGSVKDKSTEDTGGATGGGKVSGHGEDGLKGDAPPHSADAPRLAQKQARIRQEAERLAWYLRERKLPSGDLEMSVQAMKQTEDAIRQKDGLALRQAFSQAMDHLDNARESIGTEIRTRREHSNLSERMRDRIESGMREKVPPEYERLVAEYFKALAESPGPGETR